MSGVDTTALEALRRRSGIAVSRDGELTYLGRPVANDRVVELFHRGLDVRADGEVTLSVGRFWCYPEVAGVARFVCRIRATEAGGVATLASGHELPLAGSAIGYGPDDRFYVWLEGLVGPAIVLREAHQVLVGLMADDPDDAVAAVGTLGEIPRPGELRPGNLAVSQGFRPRAGRAANDGA